MSYNPYQNPALRPRGIYNPPAPTTRTVISDSTLGIGVGSLAINESFVIIGQNDNRVYLIIQNNCASASIAIGFGSANAQGIVILAGGYYEREIYCPTQEVYGYMLAAGAAGDYVTVDYGSNTVL